MRGKDEDSTSKQEEVFEKLIELTRENAAIKEQLAMSSHEYEAEISAKEQNIYQLDAKIK